MSATPIQLDQFDQYFSQEVELSSVALGASITSVSDQFFAPASDLLKVYVRRTHYTRSLLFADRCAFGMTLE